MKKILIVGAGAMGAAFSIPLLDNGHSVTLTEPYNFKLLQKLNLKKKIHPSLNINLPQKLKIIKLLSILILLLTQFTFFYLFQIKLIY